MNTPIAHAIVRALVLSLVFAWAFSGGLAAQTPQRIPAGQTVFQIDVTAASQGTEYQLEADGVVIPKLAGAFTVGVFAFDALPLTVGTHALRARSCMDWGATMGGVACSSWTPLLVVESVVGAPQTPSGLRIGSVTVVLVP